MRRHQGIFPHLVRCVSPPDQGCGLDGLSGWPSLEQAVTLAADHLIHVQVSENYRGTPGTGQTQWDSLKRGLKDIHYQGAISIESFTPEIQELAGAVCIWKNLADNQDDFARDGLRFLKKLFND